MGEKGSRWGVEVSPVLHPKLERRMPKSVDDLRAIRDQLRKRRAEVASEITGDMDHGRIDQLALIHTAILALDQVIADEGPREA